MPEAIAQILNNDKSLKEFVAAMHDFNQAFCDAIADGVDFTIKLEVRGNLGQMLHARVLGDRWRRPAGVEKRVEKRQRSLGIHAKNS